VEFIRANNKTFAFIKYAIVCIPLETPKVLFLRHYRAAFEGWRTFNLCAACCRDCTHTIQQFVNKCYLRISYPIYPNSCKCKLWLRQPPTLRDLATRSVFHLTFNLSEFQLTAQTLYHHFYMPTCFINVLTFCLLLFFLVCLIDYNNCNFMFNNLFCIYTCAVGRKLKGYWGERVFVWLAKMQLHWQTTDVFHNSYRT